MSAECASDDDVVRAWPVGSSYHRSGFCHASFNSSSFDQISHSPFSPAIRSRGSFTVVPIFASGRPANTSRRAAAFAGFTSRINRVGDSLKRRTVSDSPAADGLQIRHVRTDAAGERHLGQRHGQAALARVVAGSHQSLRDRRVDRREHLRGQFAGRPAERPRRSGRSRGGSATRPVRPSSRRRRTGRCPAPSGPSSRTGARRGPGRSPR